MSSLEDCSILSGIYNPDVEGDGLCNSNTIIEAGAGNDIDDLMRLLKQKYDAYDL
jgi:hypothetical protein